MSTLRALVLPTSLALVVLAAAPGLAASGETGKPQPEAAQFRLAPATTEGVVSTAMLPNGDVATAFAYGNGTDNVEFCLIGRTGRSCTVTTTITPSSSQSVFGTPQVIAISNTDIDVLVEESNEDALYQSTNGGVSFESPLDLGETTSVGTSTVAGDNLVFSGSGSSSYEDYVESTSYVIPTDPGTQAAVFDTGSYQTFSSAGLGTYDDGVLVGVTNNTGADEVQTAYAPEGSNFNAKASYTDEKTISGETELSMSGPALLSEQTSGKEEVRLRMWNGTTWSSPATVPDYTNSGPALWSVFTAPSGKVYVISSLAAHGYDIYVTSTSNDGSTWSTPRHLENATSSFGFGVALDAYGEGLMASGDAHDVYAYPVLGTQSVSIKLAHSSVKVKKSDKVTGTVSPGRTGTKIELQQDRKGKWYDLSSTTESASGTYSFSVKKTKAEKLTLRVRAADEAGYLEYGYSASKKMTFKK